MQLSDDSVTFTPPEPFAATRTWTLAGGNAAKTVYVRYLDRAGNFSKSFLDTITLDSAGPVVGGITATPNPFAPQLRQTTTIRIPVSDNLSGSCSLQIRSSTPPAASRGPAFSACSPDQRHQGHPVLPPLEWTPEPDLFAPIS